MFSYSSGKTVLCWFAAIGLLLALGLGCPGSGFDPGLGGPFGWEPDDRADALSSWTQDVGNAPFVDLPPFFDWRQNGGNYMTPVRSQNLGDATCSSCWAFASVAVAEAMLAIQEADPLWDPDLSEQMVVSCSSGSCDPDAVPTALSLMASEGVAEETCLPYEADDSVACDEACEAWQDRAWRVDDWEWVPEDEQSLKQAILDGPVIAKMDLYTDFVLYESGVYERRASAIHVGGHFVVLIGWDDELDAWIGKNSFGADWGEDSYEATGEGGWFRIGYGESEIGRTAYRIESMNEV